MAGGSGKRPGPNSPHAIAPSSGAMMWTLLALIVVAGIVTVVTVVRRKKPER
jgi:hypothetical protein